MTDALRADITAGAYWLRRPESATELVIAFMGAIAPEAMSAYEDILEDIPGAGLLAITSLIVCTRIGSQPARRAERGGRGSSYREAVRRFRAEHGVGDRLRCSFSDSGWLGSVAGHRIYPLGVDAFGQSGDLPDLYQHYGIDSEAILEAAARACIKRLEG